ncbi:hypothetical protein RvY_16718 [Ramazzottius varieornatus]|uniref:Uncharacterized protein n=1 Tax=Ramazzottius varieornatus TaxID=947166 RepID=A0A1D1W6T7_RAMVA|nr:hypothetical protein RvY_16710 [Ramazzottius varieornatus]GAV06788.1 hypothetical protein RvY_16718 [Ramazzottius varieornatus]
MANVSSDRRHLLFLCKPEFGHMIPLLSLAQRLSVYHDITLAVSQIRLTEARARGIIPSCSLDSKIAFYGVEDGLTEPSEHDVPFLQVVAQSLQSGKMLSELLGIIPTKQGPETERTPTMKPVDAIFCDILMTVFVAPILKARAVPLFMVESAGAELMLL